MQLEIKIDAKYGEPKVLILTAAMSEEVNRIVKQLSPETSQDFSSQSTLSQIVSSQNISSNGATSLENFPQILSGSKNDKIEVLEQDDLIRIYANNGKVYALTTNGEYVLRLRLYEIEERPDAHRFVRISNSEIINLKKVAHFDLSFTGTIGVKLSDGTATYVSRRYVNKIKQILGYHVSEGKK